MEDWAEIRRLHRAEGLPIKEIARVLGVSRNTVRAALASDGPPKYERPPAGSIVDAVEPRIRELLQAYPTMPATVIAERIGWTRSITVFKGRVRGAAAGVSAAGSGVAHAAMRRARSRSATCGSRRSSCRSGSGRSARPTQLPVLTMVTGYSRWLSAVLIPTRTAADLFAGWWQLIAAAGRGAAGAGLGR